MSPDGSIAANSPLGGPTSLALGPTGQVYFAEYYNNRVRKIDASGVLGTVAGGGTMTGNNIPATSALLSNLYLGMCTDPAGSLYFSEWMTGLVRKVTF
jgi:streptogramin lyase